MVEDEGKKEEFEFTREGEALGYISLDQARVLAMSTARDTPSDFGGGFQDVSMAFAVAEAEETEDYYVITLSFRPQGQFSGTPGQEQFFIEKEGTVAHRQVLAVPRPRRGFPILPAAIGLAVLVVAVVAVAAVFMARGGSGGDEISGGATGPTVTPVPPTAAPAPSPTVIAVVPPAVSTPTPTAESTPTPISSGPVATATPVPTATRVPTPTPAPIPTLIPFIARVSCVGPDSEPAAGFLQTYVHPNGLWSISYPVDWTVNFQRRTGGVSFTRRAGDIATVELSRGYNRASAWSHDLDSYTNSRLEFWESYYASYTSYQLDSLERVSVGGLLADVAVYSYNIGGRNEFTVISLYQIIGEHTYSIRGSTTRGRWDELKDILRQSVCSFLPR